MEHFFVVLSGLNPAIRSYLLRQTQAQKDIHYYPGQLQEYIEIAYLKSNIK